MKRRAFLALISALPLAGCGFQLRGSYAVPYRSIYLDAPRGNQAARKLAQDLKSQGIRLTDSIKDAEVRLRLSPETRTRNILSLSGGGRVREYQLQYSLSYSLSYADGREIYPETTIKSSREFTYDDNLYLAKTAEEEFLYRDLQDSAAQQILRRLSARR